MGAEIFHVDRKT